jgi:hypothetical protein
VFQGAVSQLKIGRGLFLHHLAASHEIVPESNLLDLLFNTEKQSSKLLAHDSPSLLSFRCWRRVFLTLAQQGPKERTCFAAIHEERIGRLGSRPLRYRPLLNLVDFAGYGDGGSAEDVFYFGFAQAGGVVLEGEMFFAFVETEAPQAVGVGKGAKARQLFLRQGRLQFVGDVDECHAGIIAADASCSTLLVLPLASV